MEMPDTAAPTHPTANAAARWDEFPSESYFEHNYASFRWDDQQIIRRARDFFAGAGVAPGSRGLDVGTGPNLAPALAMLPFAREVVLYEHSASNVEWLRAQQAGGWPVWDNGLRDFWEVYRENSAYAELGPDPRPVLSQRAVIVHGDVFAMPADYAGSYGLGTMFFVAESLSDDPDECQTAVAAFLGALRPGAPFVTAFMEMSEGYYIDDIRYPATALAASDVERMLAGRAVGATVERVGFGAEPLRDGYGGMLVATGRSAG